MVHEKSENVFLHTGRKLTVNGERLKALTVVKFPITSMDITLHKNCVVAVTAAPINSRSVTTQHKACNFTCSASAMASTHVCNTRICKVLTASSFLPVCGTILPLLSKASIPLHRRNILTRQTIYVHLCFLALTA